MKKFEVIREIFETIIRVGFNDDKQDSISGYTRDKMNNPVYVKKVKFDEMGQIDSVAVIALESDFSDACDSDIRIAFKGNIGKRVILYANEVEMSVLLEIRNYLRKHYGANEDVLAYQNVMDNSIIDIDNPNTFRNVPSKDFEYIMRKYYDIFVEPIYNK